MNCLEYRREILADPHRESDEGRAHARSCAGCSEFQKHALDMDELIAGGLGVPVPEGLATRVIAKRDAPVLPARRRSFAIAASLLLATLGATGIYVIQGIDPFALACIDFVVDEEANAILTSKQADPEVLMRVAHSLNVSLPSQIGEVRYIGTCPFQGTIVHHVVLITPQGKATLLLLPGKSLDVDKVRASARGLRSVVRSTGGGSLAIVAASEKSLERIESMMTRG